MALMIEIDHAKTRAKAAAAAGQPVVPQSVKGPIRLIKWGILLLTLPIYYATPFIRWDRGPNAPDQAVLLDFANGRLYAFFVEIWPQDLYLVTGLMVLAATALILTNALAGRLWCGFACPQTVWTDLFLLIERLIEGDRRLRLKNRNAPLSARRAAQIAAKHAAWLLISFATGGTLIFYFTDAPALLRGFASGEVSANASTWIVVFASTTYGLAGFARDQVCTFMCPWPRLQGAIWDPEAYTVNYRDYRGEQRMSAKKAAAVRLEGKSAGDCVDCGQCVAVCPIGIDIREGPNFACINCGLCVDACDGVMSKLGRPRGLIDYESWNNIERGHRKEQPVNRLVRPKTIGLAAACVALAATIGVAFATKTTAVLSVQHDRDPVAVKLSDGSLRNAYTVKLLNKIGGQLMLYHIPEAMIVVAAALAFIGSTPSSAHDVVVGQAWSRTTPKGAKVAGGYPAIENRGAAPDRLLSASSAAAAKVEIHRMSMQDGIIPCGPSKMACRSLRIRR